jgi:hypothetical protein
MQITSNGGEGSEDRWRRLLTLVGLAISLATVAAELSGYLDFLKSANDKATDLLNGFSIIIAGRPFSTPAVVLIKAATILSVVWLVFFAALCSYAARYERTSLSSWTAERYFLEPPREVTFETAKTVALLFITTPARSLCRAVTPPWFSGKFLSCRGLHIKLWLYLWEVGFITTLLAACGMTIYLIVRALSTAL